MALKVDAWMKLVVKIVINIKISIKFQNTSIYTFIIVDQATEILLYLVFQIHLNIDGV